MRFKPERYSRSATPKTRFFTVYSPECAAGEMLLIRGARLSGAWFAANDPIAVPFHLPYGVVVDALGWFNGSSAGGNVDVGIYDASFNRLISTGSTAGSGNSTWQYVDVTDTALAPGRYFLACARDNVTANRTMYADHSVAVAPNADSIAFMGAQDTTTNSFPLPDPLAGMGAAATAIRIPILGFASKDF